MEDLLRALREFDALRDTSHDGRADRVIVRSLNGCPPDLAPAEYLAKFPSWLRSALAAEGIESLYAHQAEAIDVILTGQDVVLDTPTASGKSLCFNIPLILKFIENPQSHALMLHPMKALSHDQRRQLHAIAEHVEHETGQRLESWVYDGDTYPEHRKLIKESPIHVLFTNPEMLHASFLGGSDRWLNFLRSLRMVIIDEIHEYRGYFGTNVALLLRRFFAKLHRLGVHPQVVLATATCGNAEEHAYRLTGRRCVHVRAKTVMRPARHFAFIDPDIPDFRFREIYPLRIARAALACMAQGLSTLIFCPSRRFAEETAKRAKKEADEYGIDSGRIVPYRSGYEASLRRQIEEGLRTGYYQAVFCTNALEIGIDIGRLDVCILAGFPDSVLSAWQRIGRVGRSWDKKAYILFYAFNNPFDRFFASNIDAFLEKPLDEILIGVDNEELMDKHYPYLIYEMEGQLSDDLREVLGDPFWKFARDKNAGTRPVLRYGPNYNNLSIRGSSSTVYRLMYKDREIGTISSPHLFREAYVGAIYNHFGQSYKVVAHGADEVYLEDAEPHLRTEGIFYTVIQEGEVLQGVRYNEVLAAYYGKINVFENFGGYRLIDTRSNEVVDEDRKQTARLYNVRGFWLELENSSVLASPDDVRHLFGLEQLLRIGAPFIIPCDRHDLGTHSKSPASIYLYETVPGGIGVAERALDLWPRMVQLGIKIAERCKCKHGCPSCLVPPRLPPNAGELRKGPAIALARQLLKLEASELREKYDPAVHAWVTS